MTISTPLERSLAFVFLQRDAGCIVLAVRPGHTGRVSVIQKHRW